MAARKRGIAPAWRCGRCGALSVLAALVALLAAAPAAAASQRYAAPTPQGTGDCSSASNACDFDTAVSGASSGDEVIVEPGDYALSSSYVTGAISIHGVDGRPRPRLQFSGGTFLAIWLSRVIAMPTLASCSTLTLSGTVPV